MEYNNLNYPYEIGKFAPCDVDAAATAERRRHLENFLANRGVFLKMTAASMCIPKDNPGNPRGDDAHLISPENQTIAVADGVGGWAKIGIDGGEYARQLMANSFLALQREPKDGVNPKRVLQEAFNNTTVQGSSTACIITLSGEKLRAANVGDSGFLVIRDGGVVYRSPTQQRNFNFPYQLGTASDNPSVADEIEVTVKKGDIVVAATDGLLDNVNEITIAEIVGNPIIKEEKGLEKQARYLANLAVYNSFDQFAETPFSTAARSAGKCHRGGKPDDITVIIARVDEV